MWITLDDDLGGYRGGSTDCRCNFSLVPTSPDCVFFVTHNLISDQIRIIAYSVGDETWKIHTFTCLDVENYVVEDAVYMDRSDGSSYCFSEKRRDCSHPSISVHKSGSR